MTRVDYKEMNEAYANNKSSSEIRHEVISALDFAREQGRNRPNASMLDADIRTHCSLGLAEEKLMKSAYTAYRMSARSYNKVLRVARSIADLEGSKQIKYEHLAEALSYRIPDSNTDGMA